MSKSLVQFIIEEQRAIPGATGDFTGLVSDIIMACKQIAHDVNKGALIGVLGSAGSENVQGETQKKLDIITNEVFIKSTEWGGHLAAMASEERQKSGLRISCLTLFLPIPVQFHIFVPDSYVKVHPAD